MDTVSKAVRAKEEYNPVFRNVDNLGIISKIQITELDTGNLLKFDLLIKIGLNSSKLERDYNLSKEKLPITFFEAFGFNKEFTELFSELEKVTTLSKEELSYLLREKIKATHIGDTYISFSFIIPNSKFNCTVIK